MIFRHEIYAESVQIIQRWEDTRHLTQEQAEILRACWQCSKFNNLLVSAFNACDCSVNFNVLLQEAKQTGFLSSLELWHTRRAKDVRVYRGCDLQETDDYGQLGLSWTLSKEVAEFFASRNGYDDPVIVTARFPRIFGWLDTAEHEVIISDAERQSYRILSVESYDDAQEYVRIDWKNRPRLRPSKTFDESLRT